MSIDRIIQTRRLHVLFLLPFLLAGIVAGYHYLGGKPLAGASGEGRGIITWSFAGARVEWLPWAGALWLLLLSYLLFFIAERHKALSLSTSLPSLIYLLSCAGLFCRYGVNAYMIAAALVALAVDRLQVFVERLQSNTAIFDFGLLVSLSVLFCPKLVMLVPWAILVLPFSGRTTLRDVIALLLGFFTTSLFVSGYYFLFDAWEEVPGRFMDALHAGEWSGYYLIPRQWIIMLLLVAVTLVSVVHVLAHISQEIVSRRRGVLALVWLLLFLGSTFFLLPLGNHAFLLVLFIPLSYLHARYFASYRGKWTGGVLFLSLLAACLLMMIA